MSDKKQTPKQYKINYTLDTEKGTIRVKFTPTPKKWDKYDTLAMFNGVLSGVVAGMHEVMSRFNVLRPPSDQERTLHAYVFKDEEHDNALYKERKRIYDTVVGAFDDALLSFFPDVIYIEQARKYQQEFAYEKTQEEVDEYLAKLETLVEDVRSSKYDEEDE